MTVPKILTLLILTMGCQFELPKESILNQPNIWDGDSEGEYVLDNTLAFDIDTIILDEWGRLESGVLIRSRLNQFKDHYRLQLNGNWDTPPSATLKVDESYTFTWPEDSVSLDFVTIYSTNKKLEIAHLPDCTSTDSVYKISKIDIRNRTPMKIYEVDNLECSYNIYLTIGTPSVYPIGNIEFHENGQTKSVKSKHIDWWEYYFEDAMKDIYAVPAGEILEFDENGSFVPRKDSTPFITSDEGGIKRLECMVVQQNHEPTCWE